MNVMTSTSTLTIPTPSMGGRSQYRERPHPPPNPYPSDRSHEGTALWSCIPCWYELTTTLPYTPHGSTCPPCGASDFTAEDFNFVD